MIRVGDRNAMILRRRGRGGGRRGDDIIYTIRKQRGHLSIELAVLKERVGRELAVLSQKDRELRGTFRLGFPQYLLTNKHSRLI